REVFIEDGSGRFTCLLIENKIYASFEPRQAERYRLRGAAYVQNGRCQGFTTILVAPRAYFGADPEDRKGFDASLFYEAIRDWFSASALGGRVTYKTHLLDAAVRKAKFGYQPEEDARVIDFWRSYWEIAVRMAPELEMPEPLAKPARAGFIYFRPPTLPKG